ncbi:DMT family transporter [Spongisporangium articulatum]|uniref:DMT family transporter n=1 Tax=Spongisporangium articulatum TaxID=3362603 RepID=A0ABW8AQ24_9ACTN
MTTTGGSVTWAMLTLAVFGISTSAPLSVVTAAPVVAISFWRNVFGALVSGVWLLVRREPVGFRWTSVFAGLLLAVHFTTWLTGLRMTSVTAATALVCTTPVWTVALDLVRRVPVPRAVLLGVGVAIVGVFAITGVDAAASGRALTGDLLSVVGAITAAGYVALGAVALGAGEREGTTTAGHTFVAYGTCAAALLPVAFLGDVQLVGFSAVTWFQLGVVTVGAQLFGHTMLNALLPRVGVTTVALATLLEVPGATLVAWAITGDAPPFAVLPGTALMLLGLVLVVRAAPEAQPEYAAPD